METRCRSLGVQQKPKPLLTALPKPLYRFATSRFTPTFCMHIEARLDQHCLRTLKRHGRVIVCSSLNWTRCSSLQRQQICFSLCTLSMTASSRDEIVVQCRLLPSEQSKRDADSQQVSCPRKEKKKKSLGFSAIITGAL